jgi:hypothetical protein
MARRKTKAEPAPEPAAPEEEAVAPVVDEDAELATTDEPTDEPKETISEDDTPDAPKVEEQDDEDWEPERKPGDPVPYDVAAVRVHTRDGREGHMRAGRTFGARPQTIPLESMTPNELEVLEYCPVLEVEFIFRD